MSDPQPLGDPRKFSTIGHSRHRYFGPMSPARAAALIEHCQLGPQDRVLDVGCGQGTFLLELLQAAGGDGLGVDVNPAFVARARAQAERMGLGERARFVEAPLVEAVGEEDRFGAILCMGSSQAVGSFGEALRWAWRHLLPGGTALFADGHWRRDPASAYLELLGATPEEMNTHAGNAQQARDAGFRVLCTAASNPDEWDQYEGLYCSSVERYVEAHPDDPDGPAMAARIRRWHAGYLQWGRDTLGYGFYLLLRPSR